MNNRKAAALARVSSTAQAKDDRHGIPNQLRAIRDYAARTGLDIAAEYTDTISGASETREAFYRLLADADQYQAVIVYHLDRIGRDARVNHNMIHALRQAGLEIHATNRGLVSDDLMTDLEIAISAQERRAIRARTQAGLIAQARRGLLPNGTHAYGYRNVPGTGRAILEPKEAEVVRQVFQLSAEGKGYRTIGKLMNEQGIPSPRGFQWSHTTARSIIQNPTYKGEHHWKHQTGTYIIPVPPVVTPELWERAQGKRRGAPPKLGFALTGHLRCGICGAAMSARKRKRYYTRQDGQRSEYPPYRYYRCNSRNMPSGHCGQGIPYAARLERLAETELRRMLSDEATIRKIAQASRQGKPVDERALATLRQREADLLKALKLGGLSPEEFTDMRTEVRAEINALLEPEDEPEVPMAAIIEAARTLPLRELLEYAKVTVLYTRKEVKVTARF